MEKMTREENTVAIKLLDQKIDEFDKEVKLREAAIEKARDTMVHRLKSDRLDKTINCSWCEQSFSRFVEVEKHINHVIRTI